MTLCYVYCRAILPQKNEGISLTIFTHYPRQRPSKGCCALLLAWLGRAENRSAYLHQQRQARQGETSRESCTKLPCGCHPVPPRSCCVCRTDPLTTSFIFLRRSLRRSPEEVGRWSTVPIGMQRGKARRPSCSSHADVVLDDETISPFVQLSRHSA